MRPPNSPPSRRLRALRTAAAMATAVLTSLLGVTSAWALDDAREGTPRAAAPDQLAGQLILRGALEVVGPVGDVAGDVAVDDVAASGLGFGASVGLGLSRHAELVLAGGYATLGDPARCSPCGGDTARVGLGLAYHLAQGTAMDPWARWGVGFRTSSLDDAGATNRIAQELAAGRYHGLDLTQLVLGTTWSPVAGFGLGPYVEMDLGTYVSRPDGAGSAGLYAFFTAGISLQLTPTGFGRTSAATASAAAPRSTAAGTPVEAARGGALDTSAPPSF